MTYPSVHETTYQGSRPGLMVCAVPHGAGEEEFLAAFPEIEQHPDMQSIWPLFTTYLEIERDVGAGDLAHAIAHHCARLTDVTTLVVDVSYPRGIIDGGRKMDHCLRGCLPTPLIKQLKPRFLALHQQTLDYTLSLYDRMRAVRTAYLLDVHTMASFCPVNDGGQKQIFPVSFQLLPSYVDQYLEAHNHAYQRKIDLITADDQFQEMGDPRLTQVLQEALTADGYAWAMNDPYQAASAYLSHQHLSQTRALSLDVPKHLLATCAEDLSHYQLDDVTLDPLRIEAMGRSIARGLARRWD